MIKWRDVVVCYELDSRNPGNALDGVSLDVAPGEWVFFVGPSGAGKSTLLKLVYGGAHARGGQIIVDDQDVTRLASREIPTLRRKIGVVFQDFQLLAQKTVWENVAFALQVIGAPQKRLVRDVPRALETVGLSHKADARPHELSGGEAQRVAIARAIVNDPLILIADEPTGNLDPQTAFDIAQVLRRVNERGTTILMATHDRALVDQMKNRVVRISEGRVVSDQAQGEYHPEDDALPIANSAAHTPLVASSRASVSSPTANGNAANGAPQIVKTPTATTLKPVNAFAGQVDASLSIDTPPIDAPPIDAPPVAPKLVFPVAPPIATPLPTAPISTAQTLPTQSTLAAPLASAPTVQKLPVPIASPAIAPSLAAANGEAAYHDSIDRARLNQAPIGSPENPIIQLDRAPEVQMPHEIEA